jgi:hypothetical protein
MRKIIIVFVFILFSGMLSAQLATWPLSANADAAQIAANVQALSFTKGAGTGTLTIGSTGAYCSGWTSDVNIDPGDYFQIGIAPQTGYKITITTIGFSERRSLTGPLEYQIQYDTDLSFSSPVVLTTVQIPDNDLSRDGTISGINLIVNDGDTLYLRWYGYKAESGTGTWRINAGTMLISGSVSESNPNDVNSYAAIPVAQSAAVNMNPSSGNYDEVMRFNIVDAGTSDGLPTDVTLISIANALPSGSALWSSAINDVQLKQGAALLPLAGITVTDSRIFLTLAPGTLSIADDSSTELTLLLKLNTTGLTDNAAIQFTIPASSPGWDATVAGSGFDINFPADIVSEIHYIDIQASVFSFTVIPPSLWQNVPFQVTAVAKDSYGNTDSGYSGSATLSVDFGNGNLSSVSGLSAGFNNGEWSLNDVLYDGSEWLRLQLSDNAQLIAPVFTGLIYSAPDDITLDDNFNDGSYPENPVWIGTTADFIVTPDTMLHLYTTASGDDTSFVLSPVSYQSDSIEWSALIRLAFDPSSSNWTRYYLISDLPDLTRPVNGYFIRIGETGSVDAIELFRSDNGVPVSIMRGPDGQVAVSPNVRLKITGYSDGTWKVYADLTGGYGYQLIGTANDATHLFPRFFSGFFCKYTQTYAFGKFFFDDAYCGPIRIDTVPPSLLSLSMTDSATLQLSFSEAINEADAQNILNYSVNTSAVNPVSATQMPGDKTKIILTFSPSFQSGNTYTLTLNGLHDLAGNQMPYTQKNFSFYRVNKFDVVINEILADPSPVHNLPEWEYLELYNRSAYEIDMSQWTITVGSTTKAFPVVAIPPGGYLIVTHADAQSLFASYGNVTGIFTSSTLLTNAGAMVELKDKEGRLIHSLTYSDTWFSTGFKKDGGWSLEQIDPANPCGEGSNWKESTAINGGTPGAINSVNASNPDTQQPSLIKAILVPPDSLYLYFSEIIDTAHALNPLSYSVNNGVGNPVYAAFAGKTGKVIVLVFNRIFGADTIFTLTVTGQIRDCVGNMIATSQTSRFALTPLPAANDIVINEILFDPRTNGVDFVEIYNRTSRVFNLKDIRMLAYKDSNVDRIYNVSDEGHYIFPGDYLVLTTQPSVVASEYYVPYPEKMVQVASMPSMNNDAGRVTIANRLLEVADDFTYLDDYHFQLLSSFDGVSLERINYDLPANDPKNWHSAAQNVGFATPTYRNSQYAVPGSADGNFSLEPEIFSPDMDGYNDQLYIYYEFDHPGFVANVVIFDAAGRKIRTVVSNELLATKGYFVWDGLDANKYKASTGIYVIYAEVFDLNGTVKHFKRTCVLASRND